MRGARAISRRRKVPLSGAGAGLTGTDDENGGRRRIGEQLRVGEPHDRGTIEDNEIEDLKPNRNQRQQPRPTEQICGVRGQGAGWHEGQVFNRGRLHGIGRCAGAGQIIAEADSVVQAEL